MTKLSAKEVTEKHARRLKAASEDMRLGVERVTEAPTLKAAAQQAKMKERIVASIDSGKWAAGLKRVSLEEWKGKMLSKGLPRVSIGIDEAADKVEAFYADLLPHIDAGKVGLDKLNDVTIEDSIARMTYWVRHMTKLKRS